MAGENQRARERFDLIVIGGGVNGTGIARDAAMRGLAVLLVEKRDFAAGSSGANSGMIHGGLRYLNADPEVTRLACIDSGYIQRIAPHLLFRIPFIYPVPRRADSAAGRLGERAYFYAAECYFEAYDRYQPLKNGKRHTRLSPDETLALEPGIVPGIHGAITMDEYGIDPFRLCALNARSAAEHGAVVKNHVEVTRFLRGDGGAVVGVSLRHTRSGAREDYFGSVIFNTGGPWAPRIAAMAGVQVRIRAGKGVHLTLDRRLSNYGVLSTAVDGRQIFVMPHENSSIIGTTDDDFYGDPDDLRVTEDEVAYLLEGVANVFPRVREARILRAWAGIRPTLYGYGKMEDALSREHQIIDHTSEGAPGFMTMVGGKLASYRAMSEEATDAVVRRLKRSVGLCRTHEVPLAGGAAAAPPVLELARDFDVPAHAAVRAAYRYGSDAPKVLAIAAEEPALAATVCGCEGVTGAELVHCVRNEFAEHLTDLRRRCRLAMGECQGLRCIAPAAAILAQERRLSADETRGEIVELAAERWKGQRPVAEHGGLAQLELTVQTLANAGRPRA